MRDCMLLKEGAAIAISVPIGGANKMSFFGNAVIGDDNTVDPGYFGLYGVGLLVLGAIPSALLLMLTRMFLETGHPLDLVGFAAVIAACGGAFGAAAAGVGAFRAGDKPHVGTVTTESSQKKVETATGTAPQ